MREHTDRQAITPPQSTSKATGAETGPLSRRIANAACVTVIAWLLSLIFAQPFTLSTGVLLSGADRRDFNMTDFYHIVADSRPVVDKDTSIIIVDLAFTDRDDVTDILALLGELSPRAVGIDVTFNEVREGDSLLMEAIANLPNPVMAVGVGVAPGSKPTRFMPDDYSYFYNLPGDSRYHGVINLPTRYDGGSVRQYRLQFPLSNGDTLPSFALTLARIAAPEAAARAIKRRKDLETIDYPSHLFETIAWYDLPEHAEKIKGKIVLAGAIGELGDTHATPVDGKMAGVMIHAHALSTILRGSFYSIAPRWLVMALGFTLCFLLCLANLTFKHIKAYGLWLRFIQILLIYILIHLGYWLFIDLHCIVDFSYPLLMVAFGLFALDIWHGLTFYFKALTNKFKKKSNKDEKNPKPAADNGGDTDGKRRLSGGKHHGQRPAAKTRRNNHNRRRNDS